MPPAQKERRSDRTDQKERKVFCEIEQSELHACIFDMETGNDLRLGFRQVKRRPAQLSLGRDDAGMGLEMDVITAVLLGGVAFGGVDVSPAGDLAQILSAVCAGGKEQDGHLR